jgi:hypothetical protein
MDERDRMLFDIHAPKFAHDLNLTIIIPLLMSSGLWRDYHQEQLNVIRKSPSETLNFQLQVWQHKYDRNLNFIGILKTLRSGAMQTFYNALIQTGQIALAELLESSQNVAAASENEKKAAEINPCRYSCKTVIVNLSCSVT